MMIVLAWLHSSILAHPGHGSIPADSPAHYLVEPVHAVWVVLLLAIAAAAVLIFRHQAGKRSAFRRQVSAKTLPKNSQR